MSGVEEASSPAHVLVVDDDPRNVEVLARRLLRRGYQVSTALSAAEALAELAREPVDLLLLDIMMPEVSGLELLGQLRAEASTKELPVILVSALSDTQDIVRGFELGANDYVTKPVDMPVLIARIESQLGRAVALRASQRQAEILGQLSQVQAEIVRTLEHEIELARSSGSLTSSEGQKAVDWEQRATAKVQMPGDTANERDTADLFVVGEPIEELESTKPERTLFDVLEAEVTASIRGATPMALLVLEPQPVRLLSRTHGRELGLELVGQFLQRAASQLGRTAALYRYQGTVFCALLSRTEPGDALVTAESIREAVSSKPFQTSFGEFWLTLAGGLACLAPPGQSSAIDLFMRAFDAFDRGKDRDGRAIWVVREDGTLVRR